MLRNNRVNKILIWQGIVIWMLCSYSFITFIKLGTRVDDHTNDFLINFCRESIRHFPNSEQIVYLTISDKTYSDLFKENKFNRKIFAESLSKLKQYNPEAIIIDLIFAYPSDTLSDSRLYNNFAKFNNIYLPVSFSLKKNVSNYNSPENKHSIQVLNRFLFDPKLLNEGEPFSAGRFLLTSPELLDLARGSGHISDPPDKDGIYRNSILLIKLDSLFIPSLYLSAYLNYIDVPFEDIKVEWGNRLVIPKSEDSWLDEDIEIPIDESGRTRIPFSNEWGKDFPNLSLNTFEKLSEDEKKQGKLFDFFEGKFVLIGDVSTGIVDIGSTSLNKSSPLIIVQANMLNALLTNSFISKLSKLKLILVLLAIVLFLTFSTLFTDIKIFYLTSICILLLLNLFSFLLILNLITIPIVSLNAAFLFSFILLLIQVQYFTQKGKKLAEIENLKKEHEMIEAKKIQLSMLPASLPSLKNFEIETYMSTAAIVGGDYYDFFVDHEDTLKFIVADATGHGLKAGTMVTVVKTLFVNFKDKFELKSILNQMSSIIKQLKLPKLYVCLSLFLFKNYKLEFTSAGMPPILIYRTRQKEIETITLKGMPLGHVDNFPYEIRCTELFPGDVILICSDGLTELFNQKDELLDNNHILDILKQNAEQTPKNIINAFIKLINWWSSPIEPKDDITIIIIKII